MPRGISNKVHTATLLAMERLEFVEAKSLAFLFQVCATYIVVTIVFLVVFWCCLVFLVWLSGTGSLAVS